MREPTEPIEPSKPVESKPKVTPKPSDFQAHMEPGSTAATGGSGVSPMEALQQPSIQGTPTADTLLNQVQSAQGNLHEIHDKLQTPNLTFKRQHQTLLRDKLDDAFSHIQAANKKMGLPAAGPTKLPQDAGPVTKFLQYVTDGQNELVATQQHLQEMAKKPGSMDPADMLLVQVKLSQAQQELEYASVLLSKVIDVFKQMLNIQI